MLAEIRRLFSHSRWADECLLAALRRCPHVPPEALREMCHVAGAAETWLSRIRGRAARVPVWPELSLEQAAELAASIHLEYERALAPLDEESLARAVAYTNSAGQSFETPLGDILLQAVLHSQYHRGKINLILRAAGLDPAPVDFISFARGVPAAVTPRRSA
jgi:uncharacterized damage-inducible protein DinB